MSTVRAGVVVLYGKEGKEEQGQGAGRGVGVGVGEVMGVVVVVVVEASDSRLCIHSQIVCAESTILQKVLRHFVRYLL